jgi:hypothetical protein
MISKLKNSSHGIETHITPEELKIIDDFRAEINRLQDQKTHRNIEEIEIQFSN